MPQPANHGLVLDPEALYVALDAHRRTLARETGTAVSWRQVAKDTGMSSSCFSRLGIKHGNLHINVMIKLLAWMGESDLKPYTRDVPAAVTQGEGEQR